MTKAHGCLNYDKDFVTKVLQSWRDTSEEKRSLKKIADKHGVKATTLRSWIVKESNASKGERPKPEDMKTRL